MIIENTEEFTGYLHSGNEEAAVRERVNTPHLDYYNSEEHSIDNFLKKRICLMEHL